MMSHPVTYVLATETAPVVRADWSEGSLNMTFVMDLQDELLCWPSISCRTKCPVYLEYIAVQTNESCFYTRSGTKMAFRER